MSSTSQAANRSSSSLSSSFSSSAASSMLPETQQNSSQSDLSSEHSVHTSSTPCTPLQLYSQLPYPTYPSSMGACQSLLPSANFPTPVPSSNKLSSKGVALGQAAAVTSARLKRAFAGRRKKADDPSNISSPRDVENDNREAEHPKNRAPSGTKQLTLNLGSSMFGKKAPRFSPITAPPPTPPKLDSIGSRRNKQQSLAPVQAPHRQQDNRVSVMAVSPGMTSALAYMQFVDDKDGSQSQSAQPSARPAQHREGDIAEAKEAWRKSDSTMNTIRPGAGAAAKSSRPVSMADSLQSTHTIVPANKRLSALISDVDLGTTEEETVQPDIAADASTSSVTQNLPSSSPKVKHRRSLLLNITTRSPANKELPPAPSPDREHSFDSIQESVQAPADLPTLTRAAASGIISQSTTGAQSTGSRIRGRLAAWTSTSNVPVSQARPKNVRPRPTPVGPGERHNGASTSSTFVPAAGLAKRAVEKMGRAWIGINSSTSSLGHSSSSSTPPSSYSNTDQALSRVLSNQSTTGSSGTGRRRTPNAPSGSWSIRSSSTASASLSDSDPFLPPGSPNIGTRLRGPLRIGRGDIAVGGFVFGKDLRSCVNVTLVDEPLRRPARTSSHSVDLAPFECRRLSALALRCAQHLIIWGIQEEGLFRVSGRPSHVSKLRTEFDTGADYDLSMCSPGDLDPHAVSSVFKAYLRELPEPILTHALQSSFEGALAVENAEMLSKDASDGDRSARVSSRGPGLPQTPRGILPTIRKPPSLSTLAMPSFSGMRPPSQRLLKVVRSLIAHLPEENRDLLRTVVDLVRATARESKETKMPLSNLLLVFCPSLNMNPPLLRILCDNESIWEPFPDVLDIKQDDAVIDIAPSSNQNKPEVKSTDDAVKAKQGILTHMVDFQTDSISSASGFSRPLGQRRPAIQTVYIGDHHDDGDESSSNDDPPPDTPIPDVNSDGDQGIAVDYMAQMRVDLSSSVMSVSTQSLKGPSLNAVRRFPSLTNILGGKSHFTDPLSTGRRPTISSPISYPVQFPVTCSMPTTPISPNRRSMPLLSLPSLSSFRRIEPGLPPELPGRRLPNSPSLRRLFSTRSSTCLSSPSPDTTSGNTSSYTLPPMSLDSSRFTLGYNSLGPVGGGDRPTRRSVSEGRIPSVGTPLEKPAIQNDARLCYPSKSLPVSPQPHAEDLDSPQTAHMHSELSLLPEPESAIEEGWTQSVLLDIAAFSGQ